MKNFIKSIKRYDQEYNGIINRGVEDLRRIENEVKEEALRMANEVSDTYKADNIIRVRK